MFENLLTRDLTGNTDPNPNPNPNPNPLVSRCRRFSSSVQENLSRGEGDLSDLIAINIQRGRERGVAPFLIYRNLVRVCNLTRVTSFEELETVAGFLAADVDNLRRVYRSVWDIDLFTGGAFQIQLVEYSEIDGIWCWEMKRGGEGGG